jgi:DNA recombination protein RmuC
MDPILVVVVVAAVMLSVAVLVLLLRGSRGGQTAVAEELERLTNTLAARQSEMEARLRADQGALAERLHAQELAVSKTIGDGLNTSTKRTLETMARLEGRLVAIDKAQANIAALSSQVVSLQDILSNKQARGAFGEIQLADLVRQVLPPSAYKFQATLSNNRRADCLLQLPNPPGSIVIDAKFPLESYYALRAAGTDPEKTSAARTFRAAIMTHIQHIAERYVIVGETAEAGLMFLPSEAVYAELHGSFPDVVEASHRARVFIVSPTTLWATLNTIRAVLKDVHMREQAGVIQQHVRSLLDDINRLEGRVANLGRHFGQATEDIRQIQISTEKLVRRAERIDELELDDEPAQSDVLALRPSASAGSGHS